MTSSLLAPIRNPRRRHVLLAALRRAWSLQPTPVDTRRHVLRR